MSLNIFSALLFKFRVVFFNLIYSKYKIMKIMKCFIIIWDGDFVCIGFWFISIDFFNVGYVLILIYELGLYPI